jgi:hypothetical protein
VAEEGRIVDAWREEQISLVMLRYNNKGASS